jgi:hypothetical protein
MVTRGFTGRQSGSELSNRIPPGQRLVDNFPVLAAGPTPRIDPADWTFTLKESALVQSAISLPSIRRR